MIPLFQNPSWPPGEWIIEYNKEKDYYEIKTEYKQVVAHVFPTLVAFYIVDTYNLFRRILVGR